MKKNVLLIASVCALTSIFQTASAIPPSIRFTKSEMVYPVGTEVARFRPVNDAAETGGTVPASPRYSEVATLTYKPPTSAAVPGHDDGDISASKFQGPQGLALDSEGNLYVAERYGSRIRKIDFTTGKTTTIAGDNTKDVGDKALVNGIGTIARFNEPTDLVLDSQGNIFVTDRGNNCIRKITPAGMVSVFAGSDSGESGYAEGTGTEAKFTNPFTIIIDADDNLYVSDRGNHRIRKITPAGVVYTLIGTGTAGSEDGDATTEATINNPAGTAMDNEGNIYITEAGGHKIRKYDASTMQVSTIAGSGTAGVVDGQGTAATFNQPIGIALDQYGVLYVSDLSGNKIRRITPTNYVQVVAGQGGGSFVDNALGTAAFFRSPADIVYDKVKRCLWIADSGNHAIRRVNLTGFNLTPAIPASEWGINMSNGEIYCNLSGGLKPINEFPATDFTVWAFNLDGGSSIPLRITVPPAGTIVYTITSSAGENGKITASKDVIAGNNATFNISPDEGYEINELLVNDEPVAASASYVFSNVSGNATINVTFKETGANDMQLKTMQISVYPTLLTGNTIYVELENNVQGNYHAVVRSIDGRIIHTQNIVTGIKAEIQLPEINPGFYLLEINGYGSAKFIKK